MPKVYKSNNKLAIYLPFDLVGDLAVKEGDELDFFKRGDYYIVAKKSAIAEMIAGKQAVQQVERQQAAAPAKTAFRQMGIPAPDEMALLKKLDTLRYGDRTKEKVAGMLSTDERKTLADMIRRGYVRLFKKTGESTFKYSISKSIYDSFLMRKKAEVGNKAVKEAQPMAEQRPRRWEQALVTENAYLGRLENDGYLVINSETEASAASAALEDSIRRGLVVGIRAFNKKFYVATKAFIAKSLPKIGKMIGSKGVSVTDIAKETGIEQDGVRAILYIMADNGDVTEVRRDVFKEA